jgi:predicted ATP-grasp superfamily ATP-dependent carboligase
VVSVDYRLSSSAAPYTSRCFERREVVDPTKADAVSALESIADARGGVLIPTNDEYLILVARYQERLARTFHLACPSWEQLEPAMDRIRCVELAERAGLKTPRSFAPKNEQELDDTLKSLDFAAQRYVLKLQLWTDSVAETKLRRKTTYGGANAQELRSRTLEIARRTGEFPTIQELVPGSTDASIGVTMVVDGEGDVCLSYAVRRLKLQTYSQVDHFRHPYDLGGNVFCETVHEPEAIALARSFVHALGWVGVITVEFRRDARDGSLAFVKVDPRVVRSTSLSTAIGMDVPGALYDVAIGREPAARPRDYPAGICWIWLDNYFESLWRNRRHASVRHELLGLFRRSRDIKAFAFWNLHDPLPFLTQAALRFTWARGWAQPKRLAELTRFRTSTSSAAGSSP